MEAQPVDNDITNTIEPATTEQTTELTTTQPTPAQQPSLTDFSESMFQLNQRSAQNVASSVDHKINFQALPVRAYLDQTVVPILLQGLAAVVRERPENPVEYLAAFLLKHNPQKTGVTSSDQEEVKQTDNSVMEE